MSTNLTHKLSTNLTPSELLLIPNPRTYKKSDIGFFLFLLRIWFFRFVSFRELRTLPQIKRSSVIRISPQYIMKGGPFVRPVEAQTMAFVLAHTSIPVPKIRKTLLDTEGNVYIIMDFIDASELNWSGLGKEQRESVMQQLGRYLGELRSISPPAGINIEALDKGSLLDPRFNTFGPFESFSHFVEHCGYSVLSTTEDKPVKERLSRFLEKEHSIVFTHGDLAPRNILIKDGTIVAILDWECAGWYPEYWEVIRTLRANLHMPDFWDRFRELFAGIFEDEIQLEYDLTTKIFT
ncbi:kinase-like domain-containing protein [Rhodocollybia butyracea]|uniref:Kinase-like domain-containing protein n=1 Tax=Rhodocollybia butyracea TaxID=206335 RepID=A0A9P5P199_9AGAR|nr:kinase-like domain-containing protein [Rhodocollybia butyracea]